MARGRKSEALLDLKRALYFENLPHRFSGFLLGGGGDVCVGVEREAGGEVTQHSADRLDVYSVL